ncbi:MAG: hypothetical protein ACOVP1_14370 [Bacteroidia bacterium]
MKKIVVLFSLILLSFTFFAACNSNGSNSEQQSTSQKQESSKDSASCSTETIMDPNHAKPMALMMREMVKNADRMKTKLSNGEPLDSASFPFLRFYLVEPTDPNVLEPEFFERARLFQEAYKAVFTHPTEQKKYYNLMVNRCIKCHENYCSGPIKRINKLLLPS